MAIAFYIDTAKCFGCKTCQISCANEKQLPTGVYLRRVREIQTGDPASRVFVSMACNHCETPACIDVCPVGAYTKNEDGAVIQDHSLCIGCQRCIEACPFHAPCYSVAEGATYKCDTCVDRRNAGEMPRCVASCPGANIDFGELDDLLDRYPAAQAITDELDCGPELLVKFAEHLKPSDFDDIDALPATIDRGAEGF